MRDGIVPVMDVNGNNNGFSGNGDWAWIIVLFLIFGWGRNGFGGGFGGNSGAADNYVLTSDFAQLSRQISDTTAMTERKLDGITNGLCTLGYDNLVQANAINSNINNVGMQLQQCCCDVREAISGVNFNLSQGFCGVNNTINMGLRDVMENCNRNYRELHEELVNSRIEQKNERIAEQQNEINALRLSASQAKQNAYLIDQLGTKCPIPAYLTCNPNAPLNYSVQYGNNGCGCGY